jgi:transposase
VFEPNYQTQGKKLIKKYKKYQQHQLQLLPPNVDELIEAKHMVRVIDKFVTNLSPTIWDSLFPGGGAPSYAPPMMLKVILYAYSCKIYSCRNIARAIRQDITFMWIAGMDRPDFNTINRFRSQYFQDILPAIFTELLDLLNEKSYISFNDYFVDGTKIEADAGRYTYIWRKNTERYKANVQKRVTLLFEEIDELNAAENEKYGDADLPERGEDSDITSAEIRKAANKLSKKMVETEHKKQQKALEHKVKQLNKEADKLEKYEQQQQSLNGRNSYSKTDNDATFMRLKDDRLRAAYNVQVSSENQFVTNYSISQNANDSVSFPAHFARIVERGEKYVPNNYNGDSGYGSQENYIKLNDHNVNNYLKYNTFHQDIKLAKQGSTQQQFHRNNFVYNSADDTFQCPAGKTMNYIKDREWKSATGFIATSRIYECEDCSSCPYKPKCTKATGNRRFYYNQELENYKEQARINLTSETGLKLRKRRGYEIETFFADLKKNCSFTRFSLRGQKKVEHELGLLCISYNMRKLANMEMKKAA